MTKAGLSAVILLGAVATANAAPQCYRASEIEAEQAMRYQAKLMVLSDMCRSTAYNSFVNRNADVIKSYQGQMIGYFRRVDGRKAEDAFDRYITRLANQFALGAGQEKVDSLCHASAEFLSRAPQLGKDEFRHFVADQAASQRTSYASCAD